MRNATVRPAPRRRLPAVTAVLLLAAAAAGCGLFDPADPVDPVRGDLVRLPSLLDESDSTLWSLERGLEIRSVDLYMHAFAESTTASDAAFHAFFDPQDLEDFRVATGAEPPSDWRSPDERTFFNVFRSLRPVDYQVFLFRDPDLPEDRLSDPRENTFFRVYRVWAGGVPLAAGLADFVVRRVGVNDEWKIVHWVDRRDTTGALTMGRRRLDSRAGS